MGGFVTWLAAASVTWGGLSCQDVSACKGGFQGLEQPEQFQAGWWQWARSAFGMPAPPGEVSQPTLKLNRSESGLP